MCEAIAVEGLDDAHDLLALDLMVLLCVRLNFDKLSKLSCIVFGKRDSDYPRVRG